MKTWKNTVVIQIQMKYLRYGGSIVSSLTRSLLQAAAASWTSVWMKRDSHITKASKLTVEIDLPKMVILIRNHPTVFIQTINMDQKMTTKWSRQRIQILVDKTVKIATSTKLRQSLAREQDLIYRIQNRQFLDWKWVLKSLASVITWKKRRNKSKKKIVIICFPTS